MKSQPELLRMDIARNIDWSTISYAIDFYETLGYQYIEVPWIVPVPVNNLTCPYEDLMMKVEGTNTALVGSAEQSFLKMEMDGLLLPNRKYVACTPCFRVEDSNDGWHFPTFLKVELYRTDETDPITLYQTIDDAQAFFQRQLEFQCGIRHKQKLTRQTTPEGIDLMLNGIEIGSYGIRGMASFRWVYGTGVALPRFTQAMIYG